MRYGVRLGKGSGRGRIKGFPKNKALEINRRIVADAWTIKLWKMISGDHRWV